MSNSIEEFMDKIIVKGKDYTIYNDEEKGIIFPLNTINLLARLDYLELDKQQYEGALFQKKIEEGNYDIINIKRPVPKNEITGKEEDKTTLVDREIAVRQVWNVSNGAGVFKSFAKKEEAIKYTNEINNKVFEWLK